MVNVVISNQGGIIVINAKNAFLVLGNQPALCVSPGQISSGGLLRREELIRQGPTRPG